MKKLHFTIQKYYPDDLDQILKLFHDTVHAINIRDYSQEQINAWAPATIDRNRWVHNLSNHIAYVAKIADIIVGFGDATKQGYIDRLYTHKDYQGKGIASAILKKLEEELQKLGVIQFTTEASITAKPFFERQGYTVVNSQEIKHRSGVIFINYVMKKTIKRKNS
jgi:putative acetyltransferase